MDLTDYVDALQGDLATAAAAGGAEAEAIAERLTAPLDSAARLAIQHAVVDAAAEISVALAPRSVDVRLAGRGLAFVVSPPHDEVLPGAVTSPMTSPSQEAGADEGGTSRITFRPSDRLKADIESAAEAAGLSVNAFLVRTLTDAVRAREGASAATHTSTSRGGQRISGWVR